MATTKADYYDTLGVSRESTPEEIKKAFRRLAMKHHPDRNKQKDAHERFKAIPEPRGQRDSVDLRLVGSR